MEDLDRIEMYLDEIFEFSFKCKNEWVNNVGCDLYLKFVLFMWNGNFEKDEKFWDVFNKEFIKFNEFLNFVESFGKYLDGDELKLLDCNLLFKLMYVKVVGELKGLELKNF